MKYRPPSYTYTFILHLLLALTLPLPSLAASVATVGVRADQYAQSGLIAQYDGIENAGAGLHDADATTWKDLLGDATIDLLLTDHGAFNANALVADGTSFAATGAPPVSVSSIDICYMFRTEPGGNALIYHTGAYDSAKAHFDEAVGIRKVNYGPIFYRKLYTLQESYAVNKMQSINWDKGADPRGTYGTNERVICNGTNTLTALTTYNDWTYKDDRLPGVAKIGAFSTTTTPLAAAVNVHGIRLYNRTLTTTEVAVNANIDRIRFQGADPADLDWPSGYDYSAIKSHIAVAASGGAEVSFDGTTWSATAVTNAPLGSSLTVTVRAGSSVKIVWTSLPSDAVLSADGKSVTFRALSEAPAVQASVLAAAYVQSGLITQWDGIENAGAGLHDAAATVWKDLKGDLDLTLKSKGSWNADGLSLSVNNGMAAQGTTVTPAYSAIEVVYKMTHADGRILFCSGQKYSDQNLSHRWVLFDKTSPRQIYSDGYVATISAEVTVEPEVIKSYSAVYSGDAVSCIYTNGVAYPTHAKAVNTWGLGDGKVAIGERTASSTAYGWKGEVYTIRLYDRALTADEITVNANIDKIRFEGADGSTLTWPDGYRWQSGGLQKRTRITWNSARGSVTVDGETGLGVVDLWYDAGLTPDEVTLVATPDASALGFAWWSGDGVPEASRTSTTLKIVPSGGTVTAHFSMGHTVPGSFPTLADALASDDVSDSDVITLADGTNAFEQVYVPAADNMYVAGVTKAVKIIGSSPTNVVLDCSGQGGLYIDNADAFISGVTILNFQRTTNSLAINLLSGTISNVCISGASGKCMSCGKNGAYFGPGALITDCVLEGVNKMHWDSSTIYSVKGATFRRTVFRNNWSYDFMCQVSAAAGYRTRFENCLFSDNFDYYRPTIYGTDVDILDCAFYGNSCKNTGAGIGFNGGTATMSHCIVTNNTMGTKSGGTSPLVLCRASANVSITNCLFANNAIDQFGAIKIEGASTRLNLVNTTVACNVTDDGTYAGGITGDGTSEGRATVTLVNTVIWTNTANGVVKDFGDYFYTDFHCTNSCFTGLTPTTGADNTALDPKFTDAARGDFSLGDGSSCIDTGCDLPAVADDLTGKARPIDGTGGDNPKWDIGCYEADARVIPVQCSLSVLDSEGTWPCAVRLNATVIGSRLTGLSYEWLAIYNEGGDWKTNRQVTATNAYAFADLPLANNFSFACIVSNDKGESSTSVVENCFTMLVETCYVSNTGSGTFPYTNAATAARDINSAIDKASKKIVILPGEYTFEHHTDTDTGHDCFGAVSRAVEIVGGEKAEDVVFDCDGKGGLILLNAGASLRGATFRNYRTALDAPTLYLKYGTASNIVVSGANVALKASDANVYVGENAVMDGLVVTNQRCGAVSVVGGTLRNAYVAGCLSDNANVVSGNKSTHDVRSSVEDTTVLRCQTTSAHVLYLYYTDAERVNVADCTNVNNTASALYVNDCPVVRCRLVRNRVLSVVGMPQLWAGHERLKNCFIADNVCATSAAVTMPRASTLTIENSTIVRNACGAAPAGGVHGSADDTYWSTLTILNSIVWGNTTNGLPSDVSSRANVKSYSYSCFFEAGDYPDAGNIAVEPRVRSDGQLKFPSACHDAGLRRTGTRRASISSASRASSTSASTWAAPKSSATTPSRSS